jgi:hypothetical protein
VKRNWNNTAIASAADMATGKNIACGRPAEMGFIIHYHGDII